MRKLLASAFALLALAAAPASAATVTFTLDRTVEGGAPTGSPVLVFTDTGPDMVRLTIDATDLSGGEFISNVFFNYTLAPNPITFTFNASLSSGPNAARIFQTSNGRDSPGNNGLFDIEVEFSTSGMGGGALRLNAGEVSVFDLSAVGLLATDFSINSAPEGPGAAQNFALARVQGIATGPGSASVVDSDGPDLDIIGTPTPAAIGLFGLGLLALGAARRR